MVSDSPVEASSLISATVMGSGSGAGSEQDAAGRPDE
jgi:hypothetical protein